MCKLSTSDPISEYVEARRYKNKLQDLQIQDDYFVLILRPSRRTQDRNELSPGAPVRRKRSSTGESHFGLV